VTQSHGVRPLLEVQHLQIAYGKKRLFQKQEPAPAVWDVSFELSEGETMALVGESGSGKTTIARAIAGLMTSRKGQIVFDNHDITKPISHRARELIRPIQYVFQNPDSSLNPRRKISYSLGRPLELFFGLSGAKKQQRMEELLVSVDLDVHYLDRFPRQLSGGEVQRVAIAQALAAEPQLILCDEIVSALDVSVQANILDLLKELQAKHGIAYLFIAHDLAVVRWLADRVVVLYQGRIMESGTPEDIFSAPFQPYTEMLLESIPEPEPDESLLLAKDPSSDLSDNEVKRDCCPFVSRCPYQIEFVCDREVPLVQNVTGTHTIHCHVSADELMQKQQTH
jgi:peptide/nickel transport system ATP-binding protein